MYVITIKDKYNQERFLTDCHGYFQFIKFNTNINIFNDISVAKFIYEYITKTYIDNFNEKFFKDVFYNTLKIKEIALKEI